MPPHIIPIVEGRGEVAAVPILVRRIATEMGVFEYNVGKPIRFSKSRLQDDGELSRALELAILKGAQDTRILILLDADDDCPREAAPALAERVRAVRPDADVVVVLACREYEAWFLGSLPSLTELAIGVVPNAESVRGAKERLGAELGIHYSEVVDQPSMTGRFDIQLAMQNCPSLGKLWRSIASLLRINP